MNIEHFFAFLFGLIAGAALVGVAVWLLVMLWPGDKE